MKLSDKISKWEKEKIISAFQAQAILEYERRAGRPHFFAATVLLGIFCIGLGIIALVSANWQQISAGVKLAADFILLAVVGWGIWFSAQKRREIWTEGLLFGFSLLIMGSIGLIGQVCQLQGDIWKALLFWSILTLPLLGICRKILLPMLWVPLFLVSAVAVLNEETEWFGELTHFLENAYPASLWFGGFLLMAYLYVVVKPCCRLVAEAFKNWMFVGITLMIVCYDFLGAEFHRPYWQSHCFPLLALIAFIFLLGFYVLARFKKDGEVVGRFLLTLWGFSILYAFLSPRGILMELSGFSLTAAILGQGIYLAWKYRSASVMNKLVILLALRIFVVFLQVFGSLMTTGFGLLGGGILFLALAAATKKFIVYNRQERN